MTANFDYESAKNAGYSDEEINQHLSSIHKDFNIDEAVKSGYSPQEINQYLSSYKQPSFKKLIDKVPQGEKIELEGLPRAALQYGLGAAKMATFPATAAILSQKIPGVAETLSRQQIFEDIEQLAEQKQTGVWDQQDEEKFQHLQELIKNPEKIKQFIPKDIEALDPVTMLETAFQKAGVDTEPKNFAEHAIQWAGFIKDPRKLASLGKAGIEAIERPKQLLELSKQMFPTLREASRGIGAAAAIEAAADNELGPIGTMVTTIVGDIIGGGIPGFVKGIGKFLTSPIQSSKQAIAKLTSAATKLSGAEKVKLQQDLIKQFRDAGIQADLGSITGSNIVKAIQARLAQSGLVGDALERFRTNLTDQIVGEYGKLAGELGEARFANLHEAGTAMREGIDKFRESDIGAIRKTYEAAKKKAEAPNAFVIPDKLAESVKKLEGELTPGTIKGTQQKAVLDTLSKLKNDILDESGSIKLSNVKDLINNKIALNDIIDYEVQGGAKQLLKNIVKELDNAIRSYGNKNPAFERAWDQANKGFAKHAKTFRNRQIADILKGQDPSTFMNRMNTIQGIRNIKKALGDTAEGRQLFNDLKRAKFDDVVFKNMVDGATNQLKMGKFSNILEKANYRAIVRELLGEDSFRRLERIQNATGKLAESAQKYFNASKSGTTAIDAAIVTKALFDVASLISGNPWPIIKTGGGLVAARSLTKLITDPVFLKTVEDGILSGESNNLKGLKEYFNYLARPILEEDFFKSENNEIPFTKASSQEIKSATQTRNLRALAERTQRNLLPQTREGGESFGERILESQPYYEPSPGPHLLEEAGLNEPPRIVPEETKRFNFNRLTKAQKVLARRQWNKYLPSEFFDEFYSPENPSPLGKMGTIGDWVQGEKSKQLFKDVLNVPVFRNEGLKFGTTGMAVSKYKIDPKTGERLGKKHLENVRIEINPKHDPRVIISSLYHEAWHALQTDKGKLLTYPLPNVAPTSDPYLRYLQEPSEQRARRFERWVLKDVQNYRKTLMKTKGLRKVLQEK